jgi:hypothetical protein
LTICNEQTIHATSQQSLRILFLSIYFLLLYWGYIVTFTKVLTIFHNWVNTLHHSPLSWKYYWNTFYRSHFSIFIHNYIIFPWYSPYYMLSLYPLTSHWCQSPAEPVLPSYFFLLYFCKYKIAIQRVSLWHIHIFVYYNSNWFISSVFPISTLVSFLRWFHIHSCIESTSTTFTLTSCLSHMWPPLSMTCFS